MEKLIWYLYVVCVGASLVAQMVKNSPTTPVRSLGWENPVEKEMATL